MNWLPKLFTTYPSITLILICLVCFYTTFTSFNGRSLPSFEDPQLGFETRGTEISQRLVAWDKLMEESKPYGSLVVNPRDLSTNSTVRKLRNSRHADGPIRTLKSLNEEDDEEEAEERERIPDKKKWEQLKQMQFPQRSDSPLDDQFQQIYRLNYDSNFFCDAVQPGYAQLVFSAKSSKNLFSYEAIKDLCNLQNVIESIPNYMRYCITANTGNCCNMWSLPNYIAWLSKLPNCQGITKMDVNSTLSLLRYCSKFYREGKLSPRYNGKDVPRTCAQNENVYNIMQYIVDVDFVPDKDEISYLRDTSVYLPAAKNSDGLKFYHDIEHIEFASDYFDLSAVDLGVKYSLFDEYLVHDIRYLLISTIFIVFCVWIYTGCIFITILTISAIFFSLINAYFIYTFVFGLEFFPFMNILAVIVSLGIGSDDAYIICKVWDRTKKENSHLPKYELVYLVIKHSAVAVFVTTLTTVAAFLSSYWSSVTAVRCFSIYAGLSVLINFLFMITWILSGIIMSAEWPYVPILHCNFSRNSDVIYENILNVKSSFDHYIVLCIEKYNLSLTIILGIISAISMFSVLCWPRLQVPDSAEFQLFEKKHPIEQYDLVYKDRFRFSHAYSEENYDEKLPLRFVWGILPIDSGNYLDPYSRGKLHFDPAFDVAAAESQEWLLRFCRRLRVQPFSHITMGPALSNCFIETFKNWMNRTCIDPVDKSSRFPCCDNVTFPFPRRVFNVCVLKAMTSIFQVESFLTSEVAGPRFLKNSSRKTPKIKAIVVEFSSNMSYTTSFEAMNTFYRKVDTWSRAEFSNAPAGLKNGWFVTYLTFFDLQQTLTQDTTVSILISMCVALFVLFAVTVNVPLSIIAILTITCIIFVSVSILIVLGWKLNILESIAISLAIGLSVDFSLHYAVNYNMCLDKTNRKTCVVNALSMMAAPSLMAAITTGASGLFMLPSVVLPYIQIGIFLIVVSSVSWIYASFFQMSILYRYGPENNYGQFAYPKMEMLRNWLRKRCVGREMSDRKKSFRSLFQRCKSNPTYSVHEMHNLGAAKKEDYDRTRSESFSHGAAHPGTLRPMKRVFYSMEQIPSGASSVTFIHEEDSDRHPGNTYVEM